MGLRSVKLSEWNERKFVVVRASLSARVDQSVGSEVEIQNEGGELEVLYTRSVSRCWSSSLPNGINFLIVARVSGVYQGSWSRKQNTIQM